MNLRVPLGSLERYLFYVALSAPLDKSSWILHLFAPIVTIVLVNHLLKRLKKYSSMSRLNYVILPRLPATE